MSLDKILSALLPDPGAAEALRSLFIQDVKDNYSGFEPFMDASGDDAGNIRFSFSLMILSAVKSA